jgi:predicted nucleic-acid-binding Zn-ribbon protein
MATVTSCPHCRGNEIYHHRVDARGEQIDLLPGIGGWFDYGKFDIYICAKCGHAQFFLESDSLRQLREKWEKVRTRLERHE